MSDLKIISLAILLIAVVFGSMCFLASRPGQSMRYMDQNAHVHQGEATCCHMLRPTR